jgi:hypothetical protein
VYEVDKYIQYLVPWLMLRRRLRKLAAMDLEKMEWERTYER